MRKQLRFGIALASLAGCASTGATLNSGVGDRLIERAPYYAGVPATEMRARAPRIGHLQVSYQRGATQSAMFEPAENDAMRGLLVAMTAFLDTIGGTVPMPTASFRPVAVPPNVSFGCVTETGAPQGDCAERGDSARGRGRQSMKLTVGRPSQVWIDWHAGITTDAGVDATLIVTIEVGQYLIRQTGLRGTKELELGTGYTVRLPWLTSLETPAMVVQLTGAVVGRDGKALRIGAEGLFARRTALTLSAIRAQQLISDADIDSLRTARRTDLPDAPLVWQAGLRNLVRELVGQ